MSTTPRARLRGLHGYTGTLVERRHVIRKVRSGHTPLVNSTYTARRTSDEGSEGEGSHTATEYFYAFRGTNKTPVNTEYVITSK